MRQWILPLAVLVCLVSDSGAGISPARQDSISGRMRSIKKTLRELKKTVEDRDAQQSNLQAVDRLFNDFVACKNAIPPMAEKLKGKKRESLIREYKKLQISVIKKVLDLETAVLDGKGGKAKKLVGAISAAKGKGHGKFKEGR